MYLQLISLILLYILNRVITMNYVGIDEAGRGPLAGPVTICGVKYNGINIYGVRDSKQITQKKREILYKEILKTHEVFVVMVNNKKIDELGIQVVLEDGIEQIYRYFGETKCLIDGYFRNIPDKCETIIKGDQKIYEISAASIVAKVVRDNFMTSVGKRNEFSVYNFGNNKGYGSKYHFEMLRKYGLSKLHRKTFIHLNKVEKE